MQEKPQNKIPSVSMLLQWRLHIAAATWHTLQDAAICVAMEPAS